MSTYSDAQVQQLMERLAHAESALEMVATGQIDSIMQPSGYAYLLREAQDALVVNVEKLRASEQEARAQAAVLSAILESAPDVILRVDREGIVRFANHGQQGHAPGQLVDTRWELLAPVEDRAAMRDALASVLAGGDPVDLEHRESLHGQTAWLSTHLAPVREGTQVTGAVIISRDVTDRKAVEAQLMIVERLTSVGRLAAGVAHEINNPLAALLSDLDVIDEDVAQLGKAQPLPPDLQPSIREAAQAAGRIKVIVKDLALFSRVDGNALAPVEIQPVLEAALRMESKEIDRRARLVRRYEPVPPVLANEARLGKVFLNLLVNAEEALEPGARETNEITVATSLDARGRVLVRIADTGRGIPLQAQARIFSPFFTTKPPGAGVGLGLSICLRIVSSLGGSITFSSTPGAGTEFRVSLPAAAATPQDGARPPAPATRARAARLLFVDDEAAVANAARRLLEPDHDVTAVTSGAQALDLLSAGARYELIFSDLMMPQMTGMELYARIKQLEPALADKVVFMTGGTFSEGTEEFLASVSNRKLEKPLDLRALQQVIGELTQAGG